MNCCSDFPPLDWWLASAVMASNEQHDPIAAHDGLLEGTIDRIPRLVERVTVEVEDAIGFDVS